MSNYREEYNRWMDSPSLTEEEWKELDSIRDREDEIENRFYAPLEFGTAGLRGIMCTGLHNINIHTIRHTTQSFADVIAQEGEEAKSKGVVIAYDCRLHGREFAEEAACVMAANGIHVRLFDALRPTPELSFAIRYYGAAAGLNITASHNTKEYNGYKVYWSDGAQLPPHKAKAIAERMGENDVFTAYHSCDYGEAVRSGMIEVIGGETDEAFLEKVLGESIDHEAISKAADDLKIVYTPFHGAGHYLVPEALRRLGIRNLYPVEEQMVLDGRFPTVKSPNPEYPEGFHLAIALAKKVGSDLIIGTDPDADRTGVMVRRKDGQYGVLTGNQLGVLLLDYVIRARNATGTMPENPGVASSIVSTAMARAIAEQNHVYYEEAFTGFKYIAEIINRWEEEGSHKFLYGFEESNGYMFGTFLRDKDAVTTSVMVAEMACYYHNQGMTLADALEELYKTYGFFLEKTVEVVLPGVDGIEKRSAIMQNFRKNIPSEIAGTEVVCMRDYSDGQVYVSGLGVVGDMPMSGSDVLAYEMKDGTNVIMRPSGTEPKLKVYILARGESRNACEDAIAKYAAFASALS